MSREVHRRISWLLKITVMHVVLLGERNLRTTLSWLRCASIGAWGQVGPASFYYLR